AGLESMVVRSGHRLAISLASRNLSSTRTLSETWSGVYQLRFIKRLVDDLNNERLSSISQNLSAIGKALFVKNNFKMALIGEDSALESALNCVQSVYSGFGEGIDNGFSTSDIRVNDEVI
ncbi:MAG: peptidase M16, partial [Deltaproteobacteria bacterium]|nr:peptidase M16 [Deltaproteobacteria bacterium]